MKLEEDKVEKYLKIKLEKLDFKEGDLAICRMDFKIVKVSQMIKTVNRFLAGRNLKIIFIPNEINMDITVVKEI